MKPFHECSDPHGTDEARISEEQISFLSPVKPKGGEMYIYWNLDSSMQVNLF